MNVDPQLNSLPPLDQVLLLETLAATAWPPEQSILFDGWLLRSTRGVTRRANSVWPNGGGALASLEQKLALVERFYLSLGLPPAFQMCPAAQPLALDGLLEQRGYGANAHTHVQAAAISDLLSKLPPLPLHSDFAIEISETLHPDWFDLYCASEQITARDAAVRRSILERIQPAHGFALLRNAGEPAAVGLGVAEGGWFGLFCMATLPACRRQGAASAILRALALWSQLYAAENAYLQVMVHNVEAQRLYAAAGFVTAYDYHYRIRTEHS